MKKHNILILCTGNSARSIIAEALVNVMPGFKGHSAGSHPRGEVHPLAIEVLQAKGHDTAALSSKSWTDFAAEDAPEMDLVITVCDRAAAETCPVWPGHPAQVHWGLPDPALAEGMAAQRAAFEATYDALRKRFGRLFTVDFNHLTPQQLRDIAQMVHTTKAKIPAPKRSA